MSIFSMTIFWISDSDFFGVLAQREGDVVVEVHRAEQRAVLEQHAEQLADLVEVALAQRARSRPWMMIEPALGLEQPTRVLRKTDLPVPDGPSMHGDLARGQRQGDVVPDHLAPEGLGQPFDR